MRQIVLYPDKKLRQKAPLITEVDAQLLKDIRDLDEVLRSSEKRAAGLAASQIGLNRRFFGLLEGDNKKLKLYINPKIELSFGEKTKPVMVFDDGSREVFLEGCLSFPDFFGEVKRFLKIKVSWDEIEDRKLVKKTGVLSGVEAIAFQHEADHLDGILFVDHIKKDNGEVYKWVGDNKIKWSVDKIIEGK